MKTNIVLMLLEGESDERLLVPAFSALIRQRNARTRTESELMRCDVTTIKKFTEGTRLFDLPPGSDSRQVVRKAVNTHISHAREEGRYKRRDVSRIVQVIDLDGAFSPAENVMEQPNLSHVAYDEQCIYTPNAAKQIDTMRVKREGVRSLHSLNDIDGIPYRLFYVARNLEHAFSGIIGNVSQRDKARQAAILARRYADNPDEFAQTLKALYVLHHGNEQMEWNETWTRVFQDPMLSLARGSNLMLLPRFLTLP